MGENQLSEGGLDSVGSTENSLRISKQGIELQMQNTEQGGSGGIGGVESCSISPSGEVRPMRVDDLTTRGHQLLAHACSDGQTRLLISP